MVVNFIAVMLQQVSSIFKQPIISLLNDKLPSLVER